MNIHEKYLNRCIRLAKNGLGTTYPNPLVGSVVVYNDTIIGEGWHYKAGGPHAEVRAIKSVSDAALFEESTIYVSLEPCSHYGKTPPCSDLIIASGIRNVVIGTIDPFDAVAGRGVKKLMDAGCNVTVGVLEEECRELNKRFFTFHNKKRPYIILKWAESADGYISPARRKDTAPVWISNSYSRQLVHKWRSEEQAILVGTNTVIQDNPGLNTRDWRGNSPVRVVLDRELRVPGNFAVHDKRIKTLFLTGGATRAEKDNSVTETIDFSVNIARQISDVLYRHRLQSVIIEGGARTLQTFIDEGLWDEARIFKGSSMLNNGTRRPEIQGYTASEQHIAGDRLLIVKREKQDD
ncbi:bifunctional diaminohydroxyphosphoribosylaminopyrimidine deaminase/5-amino-6-(5-phosphoribosylamino)uracil reductase RibD [Sinomicrobium kalidii]|uniref:bifunctional diaminohydroxyphosphoribosylaminopyrimidine deaminase/5-amino-6-(5-phosphoribosylamino)uracil reductase RibD n=1 Tax=Sinomicrobium kalidii TaxID=2900738 RepID=UPI001E5C7512|nr:bifunctional diaminohydroxyphosphoribosylaminopyrimidine deaminase/5-amino-6-(5-phosphoribosylamino)uracil reductase RibD [Sinomicrobium kalidii]UGU16108.1 bifunctional diaminohydroxyphosphoribosylaminopyrimidine deaminase/5-amino-6-(5-phosphoribosylamino)uracil reductase RibD [Sinomicrobium kalidii]